MSNEHEISKIREEEIARGRRPQHSDEKAKIRRSKSMLLSAILRGSLALFQQALIELGQRPGSEEFERSMKVYEQYQRDKL